LSDILANRRAFVALELGNRADIQQLGAAGAPSRVDNWLWQSYLNLAMSYHFSEADNTQPDQWQAGADSINYPDAARAIINVAFFRQNGTAIRVNWKNIAYLRRYPTGGPALNSNVGPPAIIASFGQQIVVRPLCDSQVYNVIIDFWQKPLQTAGQDALNASPPYASQGANDIGSTLFAVPDDWLEVIDYGAKLRGHADLGEPDRAQAIQQLLYGFTVPTTNKFVPGLIATMWTRRQAEAPNMDYNLQPTGAKRSYTNVS
jgi:hypothetical protein